MDRSDVKSLYLLVILASMNCGHAQQHAVMQWSATYDGPEHFLDVPAAAALDRQANFYVTGCSFNGDFSGQRKITTLRYSPSGQQVLFERYDATSSGSAFGTSIAVDDSGATYVAGISYPTSDSTEGLVIRYSPDGRIDWVAHYPVYAVDCRVVLDSTGSIYLGISSGGEIRVWKLNRQGSVIDSGSISGDTTRLLLRALVAANAGDLFVVGNRLYGQSEDGGMPVLHVEGLLARLNTHCHLLWEKHPEMGEAEAARADQFGDLVVIDAGIVRKYSSNGELLWHTVSDPATRLTGLAMDSRSRIIVSGYGTAQSSYNALVRYDPDGHAQWIQTLTDTGIVRVEYLAVTFDSSDNIYLTGDRTDGSPGVGCFTVKVDTSGKKVWETTFMRSIDGFDIGTFICVDRSASVYVGGHLGTTYNWDYLVIKYGQAPGSDGVEPIREIPSMYTLAQNFPNPFNPKTTIVYECPDRGFVSLKVYNLLGSEVSTLVQSIQQPGTHTVEFDGRGLSSGVYFYRLQAGSNSETRKLVLLR